MKDNNKMETVVEKANKQKLSVATLQLHSGDRGDTDLFINYAHYKIICVERQY